MSTIYDPLHEVGGDCGRIQAAKLIGLEGQHSRKEFQRPTGKYRDKPTVVSPTRQAVGWSITSQVSRDLVIEVLITV